MEPGTCSGQPQGRTPATTPERRDDVRHLQAVLRSRRYCSLGSGVRRRAERRALRAGILRRLGSVRRIKEPGGGEGSEGRESGEKDPPFSATSAFSALSAYNSQLMRYVTFSQSSNPTPRLGALRDGRVLDLSANGGPPSLLALIQAGPAQWQRARAVAEAMGDAGHPLDGVRLHAPIPRPLKNVFCLGLNYVAHAKESAAARNKETKIPEIPVIFSKTPTTVNGPFDDVPVDRSVTSQVDWEVELGVIIGTTGKNIRGTEALAHVFGYTVINDVSARDVQIQHGEIGRAHV